MTLPHLEDTKTTIATHLENVHGDKVPFEKYIRDMINRYIVLLKAHELFQIAQRDPSEDVGQCNRVLFANRNGHIDDDFDVVATVWKSINPDSLLDQMFTELKFHDALTFKVPNEE